MNHPLSKEDRKILWVGLAAGLYSISIAFFYVFTRREVEAYFGENNGGVYVFYWTFTIVFLGLLFASLFMLLIYKRKEVSDGTK